jgi:hypothetical protein
MQLHQHSFKTKIQFHNKATNIIATSTNNNLNQLLTKLNN